MHCEFGRHDARFEGVQLDVENRDEEADISEKHGGAEDSEGASLKAAISTSIRRCLGSRRARMAITAKRQVARLTKPI